MTRAAKTLALRNKIGELIVAEEHKKFEARIRAHPEASLDEQMRKTIWEQCVEHEAVEIYLNYETTLKPKLNLLSAIENMRYRTFGERPWIDEKELEKKVNEEFFNELYELPIFQKVLLADVQAQMEEIDAFYLEQLTELGQCPKGKETDPQVLEFKFKQGEIMQNQKKAKIKLARECYENRRMI